MLSANLEQTLHSALALATERLHEYATIEHLLLALTEDQDAVAVLRACDVDLEQLRQNLSEFIETELTGMIVAKVSEPEPTAGCVAQRSSGCSRPRRNLSCPTA